MGRGRGARLVELMTDLPHSRELSALGSLRAADGVDPVRLQRGEVDWGSEAAGDPLRWLLRRHFRARLVVSRARSARKVWGRDKRTFHNLGVIVSYLYLYEYEGEYEDPS